MFLWSYNWDLRDPLMLPQERPVSMRVARGFSGFDSSRWQVRGPQLGLSLEPQGCEGHRGIPLQSMPGLRASFGAEAGTLGFFSSADMDLGVPLEFPQQSQTLSHVQTCKSAFLSSWKSSVIFPVGLTIGIGGFLSRHHRAVTTAIVF